MQSTDICYYGNGFECRKWPTTVPHTPTSRHSKAIFFFCKFQFRFCICVLMYDAIFQIFFSHAGLAFYSIRMPGFACNRFAATSNAKTKVWKRTSIWFKHFKFLVWENSCGKYRQTNVHAHTFDVYNILSQYP